MFDSIQEAIDDLKQGKVVIVVDDENRENEGDFVALAEHTTPEVVNFMVSEGRGLLCAPITQEKAEQLQLNLMADVNTDSHGTAFTVSIDHVDTTTGISADERSRTITRLAEDDVVPTEFKRPGHIFPLIAKKVACYVVQVTLKQLLI